MQNTDDDNDSKNQARTIFMYFLNPVKPIFKPFRNPDKLC